MLVHHRVTASMIKFTSKVSNCESKVSWPKLNTIYPARAWTLTTQSRDEHTNMRPLCRLQYYQCCTIHHSIFDVTIWQLKFLIFTLNQLFEVLSDTQSQKRCLTGKIFFSIEQTELSLVCKYNITFLYAMTATYLSNINLEINKLEKLYSASQIKLDSASWPWCILTWQSTEF